MGGRSQRGARCRRLGNMYFEDSDGAVEEVVRQSAGRCPMA